MMASVAKGQILAGTRSGRLRRRCGEGARFAATAALAWKPSVGRTQGLRRKRGDFSRCRVFSRARNPDPRAGSTDSPQAKRA